MNKYFIHQHRYKTVKTVNSRTVSTGQKGSKSTYNYPKRCVNEETHCTKNKTLKNDTSAELRRDIKALTLLAGNYVKPVPTYAVVV